MNVNKILIVLVLLSLQSFAQKKDAYFLLDENSTEHIFSTGTGELTKERSLSDFSIIYLLSRKEYEERKKKIEEVKKNGNYNPYLNQYPRILRLDFSLYSKKLVELSDCELKKLNLVDFNWLKQNSWKENNPNILFKDLYFLFKIEKDKYISYKVGRTLIAH